MNSLFTAEFFSGNRAALRQLFTGTAPVVITANGLLQRTGDTTLPFHQDSNFWYLTGLNDPDLVLVLDKDKEYLIVPEPEEIYQVFNGAADSAAFSARSGITSIYGQKEGWKILSSRLKKVMHIATLSAPPSYLEGHGFYTNPARAALIAKLKETNPDAELLDLRDHLVRLRSIKQPAELAAITRAIDISIDAFRMVAKQRASLKSEFALEALLSSHFRKNQAQHGYEPIVASGANACTLHYVTNNGPIDPRRLLLIDAGAEVEHYSSDISRTFSFRPPSKRQQKVYDAVLDVQSFALSLLKPGTLLKEYEQSVHDYMGEKLRSLGLIKSIVDNNVRTYYPHATSHFLGLDTHDVGDYQRPLEAGMVLTVEPGIYIPAEKIGIRIEDDILITATGNKVLSKKLERTLWP